MKTLTEKPTTDARRKEPANCRQSADLAAELGDGHPLGRVAVGFLQQSGDFVVDPSLAHGSLPVQVYRETPISGYRPDSCENIC